MVKYDLHIQPVRQDRVYGYKCFEFGYASPLKVTGFQALINRWVKTFLTPKGSDYLHPEAGTEFGWLPGSNLDGANADVQDVVQMAIEEATAQVKENDIRFFNEPDSQLHQVELLEITSGADSVEVWVAIENVAGQSLAVRAGML
jgi:hypothetical protein